MASCLGPSIPAHPPGAESGSSVAQGCGDSRTRAHSPQGAFPLAPGKALGQTEMSNCPAGGHAGPGPCHSARQLRLPAVTNRGARPPAQGHSPPATGQKQPPKKQMHANELPSSAGPAGTSAGQKPLAHPTAALPAAGASKPWGCGPDGAGEEAKFSLKLPCKTMRPYRRLARGTHTPVLACSTQAPRDSGKRQQPAGVGEQGAAQASPRLWPPFLRQTTPEQPQPWGRLRRSQLSHKG